VLIVVGLQYVGQFLHILKISFYSITLNLLFYSCSLLGFTSKSLRITVSCFVMVSAFTLLLLFIQENRILLPHSFAFIVNNLVVTVTRQLNKIITIYERQYRLYK